MLAAVVRRRRSRCRGRSVRWPELDNAVEGGAHRPQRTVDGFSFLGVGETPEDLPKERKVATLPCQRERFFAKLQCGQFLQLGFVHAVNGSHPATRVLEAAPTSENIESISDTYPNMSGIGSGGPLKSVSGVVVVTGRGVGSKAVTGGAAAGFAHRRRITRTDPARRYRRPRNAQDFSRPPQAADPSISHTIPYRPARRKPARHHDVAAPGETPRWCATTFGLVKEEP